MAKNVDSKGRKVCVICGKNEEEVKFTANKGECNICRGKKVMEYENSPERLAQIWRDRNTLRAKTFVKGKKDPCDGCNFGRCDFCVIFYAKKKYLSPKSEETRAFVKEFNKNLLDNIRKVVNMS